MTTTPLAETLSKLRDSIFHKEWKMVMLLAFEEPEEQPSLTQLAEALAVVAERLTAANGGKLTPCRKSKSGKASSSGPASTLFDTSGGTRKGSTRASRNAAAGRSS